MVSSIESAKLKLRRAAEHFKLIDDKVLAYCQGNPYEVIREANGKEKIRVLTPPPPDGALLIGEAVYQIRSALDHMMFDLIKLNPTKITLPKNWEEKCFFPLRLRLPKGVLNPPSAQSCFSETLPGLTPQAFTFIESIQPYYGSGWVNETLGVLAKLSNIDKHRHLNITVTSVAKMEEIVNALGMADVHWGIVRNGAEVKSPFSSDKRADAVNLKRSFGALVFLDEAALGDEAKFGVHHNLESCLDVAQSLIVPAFQKFIQKS